MHSHCAQKGYKLPTIASSCEEKGMRANHMGTHKQNYKETRSVESREFGSNNKDDQMRRVK